MCLTITEAIAVGRNDFVDEVAWRGLLEDSIGHHKVERLALLPPCGIDLHHCYISTPAFDCIAEAPCLAHVHRRGVVAVRTESECTPSCLPTSG